MTYAFGASSRTMAVMSPDVPTTEGICVMAQFEQNKVLPAAFAAADNAAMSLQRKYIRWKRAEYILLVVAALAAVIAPVMPEKTFTTCSYLLSSLAFAVAIVAQLVEHGLNYRKAWYHTRVVAEEIKAESCKGRKICAS